MKPVLNPKLAMLGRQYATVGDQPAGAHFHDAFQRYSKASRESLLDLTMAAASAEVLLDHRLTDLDPRLMEAIQLTNPTLSDKRFFDLRPEELYGAVNAAKGKYFEYLVVDRLNAGEQVGPVLLPNGYRAELADSLSQSGWDMRIVGPDGATADYLQLKATDSAGYIKEALHRYPDIDILATHDAAHTGLVLDSGISVNDLRDQVSSAINVMDDSVIDQFLDYFNPLFPLVSLAALEGYKVSVGRQSLDQFKAAILRRGQRIVAAKLTGATVYAVGGGLLAIPSAFVGGLLFNHFQNRVAIFRSYRASHLRMLSMRLAQQGRLIEEVM